MVRGLDRFKEYFKEFADQYIVIGGTACDQWISRAAFTARATSDIDMILVVETHSPPFVAKFWEFIRAGQYERTERSEDGRNYYRFRRPADLAFPEQVELFSRQPDLLESVESQRYTAIPVDDEEMSSLSAMLMYEDYYNYTRVHCQDVGGLNQANIEALICLKAKAFLDLSERKEKGEKVDGRNIRKHKTDVFRLCVLLTGEDYAELPASIKADLQVFVDTVKKDLPEKSMFKEMNAGPVDAAVLLAQLVESFGLKGEL